MLCTISHHENGRTFRFLHSKNYVYIYTKISFRTAAAFMKCIESKENRDIKKDVGLIYAFLNRLMVF